MILEIGEKTPKIDPSCFVAPNATVVGSVTVGPNSSLWYGCVLRGDLMPITLGAQINIQDNAVVHVDRSNPVKIGDFTTIGHSAIIHGCTIGNEVLVGMGSTILNGAVIGNNCIIGAGSLVTQGTHIPDGMLAFGSPAKAVRPVTESEIEHIRKSSRDYFELSKLCALATEQESN